MGIFGSSKKTYVSSVAYNLAGDIDLRPNYVRQVIVGYVFGEDNGLSYGETLNRALLTGTGIRMRTFGDWARNSGYKKLIQQKEGNITVNMRVDTNILMQEIPHKSNESVLVQSTQVDFADYMVWANKYMLENYPAEFETEWVADYIELTGTLVITRVNGQVIKTPIADFDPRSKYIYANYMTVGNDEFGSVNKGLDMVLPDGTPFPDMNGWTLVNTVSEIRTIKLKTTTQVITTQNSNGEVEELTETTEKDTPYTYNEKTYELIQFVGSDPKNPERFISIKYTSKHISEAYPKASVEVKETVFYEDEPQGWVTREVTTKETIGYRNWYREDNQEISQLSYSPNRIFIYKEKSGNPRLDTFFGVDSNGGSFFPFVPVRYHNRFLSDSYYGDVYKSNSTAIFKAINSKYSTIEDAIKKNPDLGDIDHVFISFGVSLNTKDNSSKKYLYQFFKTIYTQHNIPTDSYESWSERWKAAAESHRAYSQWLLDESNKPVTWNRPKPVPPVVLPYPSPPNFNVRVYSTRFNYDMLITWLDMKEVTGTGKKKPDAKQGDVWVTFDGKESYYNYSYQSGFYGGDEGMPKIFRRAQYTSETITIHFQETVDRWRSITIWGLNHRNMVYGGKSVNISPKEALDDKEESGFIIPLHEAVFKSMNLVDASQITTACSYLVFNCYQVVKKKWYQTGFFKIAFIIVTVAITVYTGGASAGLLGTNMAVGAALGFSGMAAAIAGGIANAVAAALVTQLVSVVSTTLLGDKLGYLIASIASIAVISIGTSMANGQTFSEGLNQLLKADNLIQLTNATVEGINKSAMAGIAEYQRQSQDILARYEEESSIIKDAYNSLFGSNNIDPATFTSSSEFRYESLDTFLSRTLMTGLDIAQSTHSMIDNFSEISLNLKLE